MNPRILAEKPHKPAYHGPSCGRCGSRRTERVPEGRKCCVCGSEGSLRVLDGSVKVVAS